MDPLTQNSRTRNLIVLVRFNSEENPLSIQTRFLSVTQVEKCGAEGFLDAVVSSLMVLGLMIWLSNQNIQDLPLMASLQTQAKNRVYGCKWMNMLAII